MSGEQKPGRRVIPLPVKQRASGGGANHGRRIAALEERMGTVETTVAEVKADTSQILDVLTAAKTVGGFTRKYGTRILTFLGGIAVAKGFLSPEMLSNFLHIFG